MLLRLWPPPRVVDVVAMLGICCCVLSLARPSQNHSLGREYRQLCRWIKSGTKVYYHESLFNGTQIVTWPHTGWARSVQLSGFPVCQRLPQNDPFDAVAPYWTQLPIAGWNRTKPFVYGRFRWLFSWCQRRELNPRPKAYES